MDPIGVGHPDWQAYSNWRQQLVTLQGVDMPVDELAVGSFVTTNWASLHVNLPSASVDVVLEIEWFADVGGTLDIDSDGINVPANCSADVLMPVKGNLALITVVNTDGIAGLISLSISATNMPTALRQYVDSPVSLGDPNTTVNHSSTLLVAGTDVIGGRGYIDYVPHDSSGNVTVDVFGSFGGNSLDIRIASLGKPTVEIQRSLIVPECVPIVRMINGSATVNEVFDLGMFILSQ